MKRSASLCGRGCRSAGADAWEILRGSPSGIIEKQLPAGRAHSTIGKQLPPWKAHGTSGSSSTAQSKAPSGRATFRTSTIGTSNVPNQQHRDAQPAEPTPSGSSYRQGRRKARHLRGVTAGRETARLHREAASQRKARRHRYEQPAEPSASRCASCRTSTIGKQLHSAKQSSIGTSNLPNQQHREEHFLSNNGDKWADAEG